ncbi:MAG: GFA family protein [Herminiimonas sp.]|nr:GFA family protein [Herminiimonas sp.]
MISGSCLCKNVQYEYTGEVGYITVCHCSDCRKTQGTVSVVAAPVDVAQLRWISGQQDIAEFESSPGKKRAFCRQCGAPLYSRRDDLPGIVRLRMGSIDTPHDLRPAAHIFVNDLPPWADLDDDWPRFGQHEPLGR